MIFGFHELHLLQHSIGLKIKAGPSARRRRSRSYIEDKAKAPTQQIRRETRLGS